jgi:signal transduction histidine kinase
MYQQEIIQRLNRNLAKQIVQHEILIKNGRIREKPLKDLFHMIMVVNPNIEIYLLDQTGKIIAFSAPAGKVKRDHINLGPIKRWLEGDDSYPLTNDDPRNPRRKKVFSVARIPDRGKVQGYLYVILGGESFDTIAQKFKGSYIIKLSTLWIVASLLFALLTGLLLFAYLTRRLKRLATIMDSFNMTQTATRLHSITNEDRRDGDEIDRLASAFSQLVDRLQIQMENLKQIDTLRRDLIANVSHDLRTPLATLHGFIETLSIKNNTLDSEERRHHIAIALQHCERLNKLVDELFELAKLDSCETKVQYEPFNIIELAHDVVQKFNLSAEKKHITIQIDHEQVIPFANADVGLIERVIENLLDNAVRHTSKDGLIRLSFNIQDGDLAIHIRDTGCGIPEEDLPYIFDRFYKKERSQGSQTNQSGLGLAIAKRILELHQKTITVQSTVGSGTSFTFFLPLYHPA